MLCSIRRPGNLFAQLTGEGSPESSCWEVGPWKSMTKSLLYVVMTGALLGTAFVDRADAKDKHRGPDRHRAVARVEHRSARYFGPRDVVVIRNYYRPYYRPAPARVRYSYRRDGYMPIGWERRIRPVPVYVQRELVPVPVGYRRGIIDGHVVVHNNRGLIIDVAALF